MPGDRDKLSSKAKVDRIEELDEATAEDLLRRAAKRRDEGLAAVDQAVVETADVLSRRRAADLIGRSHARVIQIINEARGKGVEN